MSEDSKTKDEDEKRKERNRSLINRMKSGEDLSLYKSSDTWFPPRPVIQKNRDAIRRLYGETSSSDQEEGSGFAGEVQEGRSGQGEPEID